MLKRTRDERSQNREGCINLTMKKPRRKRNSVGRNELNGKERFGKRRTRFIVAA